MGCARFCGAISAMLAILTARAACFRPRQLNIDERGPHDPPGTKAHFCTLLGGLGLGHQSEFLEQLRRRTPEEIGSAVMLFGPALTPEFWRALELLRMERSAKYQKAAS